MRLLRPFLAERDGCDTTTQREDGKDLHVTVEQRGAGTRGAARHEAGANALGGSCSPIVAVRMLVLRAMIGICWAQPVWLVVAPEDSAFDARSSSSKSPGRFAGSSSRSTTPSRQSRQQCATLFHSAMRWVVTSTVFPRCASACRMP